MKIFPGELAWTMGLCLALTLGCSEAPGDLANDSQVADMVSPLEGGAQDGAVVGDSTVDGKVTSDGASPNVDGPLPAANVCVPLPAPSGTIVTVTPSQASDLSSILASAQSGTTIALEDGTYLMEGNESQRRLQFNVSGVTLRSASGDRNKVIIDGEYQTLEMITVQADDVTIADLTLRRAVDHLIHTTGNNSKTITGLRLHNLKLVDSGEQFVKVSSDGDGHYVDDGRLECCDFEMTDAGRPHIESNYGGCYTGGIDAHSSRGWQVRLNTFKGIYCTNGSLAEHAIHFWDAARDTLVERNTIIDCARGVGFGLLESKDGARTYADNPYPNVGYIGHIDGIIRNNVIHAGGAAAAYFDTAIELSQARGASVYHNTIASEPTYTSISYRFANTVADIRNNLTFKISQRDGATATVDHNLEATPASLFVDPANANYRLKASASQAIDQGVVVGEAGLDLEGVAHDVGLPDLGAYEYSP
ncbi:MAG: hypothetical protein JRH20_13335 [Deltaproteobacteria bacterium]|nr:hypothetical protein [Deltaproteobacteria bacterium]